MTAQHFMAPTLLYLDLNLDLDPHLHLDLLKNCYSLWPVRLSAEWRGSQFWVIYENSGIFCPNRVRPLDESSRATSTYLATARSSLAAIRLSVAAGSKKHSGATLKIGRLQVTLVNRGHGSPEQNATKTL